MEHMLDLRLAIALTLIAFVIVGYFVLQRIRKHEDSAKENELGEDVPPAFPGKLRPRSLPSDFGKGPGHK